MELLAGALGGSLAFEAVQYLRREKRQRLTNYEVRVEAQQAERPPRQIVAVRIHHIVTGEGVDPAAVSEAIRIADKACMIRDLLRHTATITTTFEVIEKMTGKPEGEQSAVNAPASELPSSRRTGPRCS
jgi:putative redox protein